MDTSRRGEGGLQLTADVPVGSRVAPGDDIRLRLTWDPKGWSGPQLDQALACVRVKGQLDPDLSAQEQPTDNDGLFEYRLHVPENIRPDCDICVQGFIAGQTGGGAAQVGSEEQCFMSGPPDPPGPPPTTPATMPPAPASTTTTAPRLPTEVGGITASKPSPAPLQPAPAAAPAPDPAVAGTAELPRTGSPLTQLVTAGGGLMLSLGGLAVMGGAGRRSRRRANR